MLQMYPRLKLCSYIMKITGVFGIAFLSVMKDQNMIGIILGILYLLGVEILFQSIARKRMQKITRILTEECKATEYLEEIKKYQSTNKFVDASLKNMLALGYLYLGQYEEYLETLKSINIDFKNNPVGVQSKIVYYNNLAVAYGRLNDVEKAGEMLDIMKNTIKETNKLSDIYKQKDMLQCKMVEISLDLKINPTEENYKKAEIIYLNSLERAKENIEKVALHALLADIYEKLGKTEQQERSMEYVLKNGGDTHFVQEIKNMKKCKE